MRTRYCIIADDFTGAGDTAVQFRKQGYSVYLPLKDRESSRLPDRYDILVLSTESRFLSREESRQVVSSTVESCMRMGFTRFFKKIDSTLRGQVAVEIGAVMDAAGYGCALVAPAVPQNGRTVVDGHCLVGGVPLNAEGNGKDLFNPVEHSSIPRILEAEYPGAVGLIGLSVVRQGGEAFRERLMELRRLGNRIIVADSENLEDLKVVAGVRDDESILFVGASGLSEALAEGEARTVEPPVFPRVEPGRMVFVVGSITAVSGVQLKELERTVPVSVISVQIPGILRGEEEEASRIRQELSRMSGSRPLVIHTRDPRRELREDVALAGREGIREIELGEKIAAFLGKLCAGIFRERSVEMLFLTGGNTAARIAEAMGMEGIEFLSEVLPGIPLGRFSLDRGRKESYLITKAGGFGSPEAMIRIYESLSAEVKPAELSKSNLLKS